MAEGKDLVEEIEEATYPGDAGSEEDDELEEAEEDNEDNEDSEDEGPGPVKHMVPEAVWKKTLAHQGGGDKRVFDSSSPRICAICGKLESRDNRFFRGVCRRPCYNQWYSGKVEHPILGKFKAAQREEPSMVASYDICLAPINIDLEQYPLIRKDIYREAGRLSLPVAHLVITLLSEALAARRSFA